MVLLPVVISCGPGADLPPAFTLETLGTWGLVDRVTIVFEIAGGTAVGGNNGLLLELKREEDPPRCGILASSDLVAVEDINAFAL